MFSRRSFMGLASFPTAALVISQLAPPPIRSTPVPCLPAEFQEALDEAGVTLIAGRPGVGRTAIAAYVACHVAYSLQRRVLWISLREVTDRVAHRIASLRRGLFPVSWSMHPRYENEQSENLDPLDIREDWGLVRGGNLSAFVRGLPPNRRPALVVVDGLGSGWTKKGQAQYRPQTLSSFLYGPDGVAIAYEMCIPVLCTALIRRNREEERPAITDLVESIRGSSREGWPNQDTFWSGAVGRAWLLSRDDQSHRPSADEGAVELAMYQEPLAAPVTRKYNFNDVMTGLQLEERT